MLFKNFSLKLLKKCPDLTENVSHNKPDAAFSPAEDPNTGLLLGIGFSRQTYTLWHLGLSGTEGPEHSTLTPQEMGPNN